MLILDWLLASIIAGVSATSFESISSRCTEARTDRRGARARSSLGLMDREDPLTQLVAEKIIAAAKTGERNPECLRDIVLAELCPEYQQGWR